MALENILSQEIVQKLGWTLLHFVWQAAAVALLLTILLALLRKSTANLRYIVACAALGFIVLLPIVTLPLVPVSTPQPTASIESPPTPIIVPAQTTIEEIPSAGIVEYKEPVPPESINVAPMIPWKQRAVEHIKPALPYLVAAWLLGVFGLSIWHLGGWAQLQRLKKQMVKGVDVSLRAKLNELSGRLKVKRAVQLLESALIQVPTVVGWLRPVILLPASALTGLTTEQLEALLAHELAHIRRYDYLVNMLQTVAETLGFYHPAVWWVSHKIRLERENCCDDLAVSISGDRIRYARALTSMEEIRGRRGELAVAADGGNLFGRIRRLVAKEASDSSRAGWIPAVITILLIAIIAVPTTIALTTKSKSREPQQEMDVIGNIKLESAEWENIGGIIPPDFNDTKVLTENINLDSIGQDCEGKVFISSILDSAQSNVRRYRFVLVQKNGNILEPSGYTTFGPENKLQEKFSFNVPFRRQDIEGFRFQTRPLPLTGIDDSLPQLLVGNFTTIKQGKFMPYKLAPPGRYAIELDGIDDYLFVPDSPSLRLDAPFTVEMWIKTKLPADPGKDYEGWAILSKGFYVGTPRAWLTGFGIVLRRYSEDLSQLHLDYSIANNSGLYTQTYGTTSTLTDGKSDWIHISHVFDGENYKSAPGQPLVIGKFLFPITRPLMGQIGEIRIWHGARTREQIRQLENVALTGSEPDLAAWWTFEQTEGQFAYDMSGNKNHARLGSSSRADDTDPKWIDLEASPNQAEQKIDISAEVASKVIPTELESTNQKTITGVVRDEQGEPVEGVKLILLPSLQDFTSNTEGKFEINWDPQRWVTGDITVYLVARHEQRNLATIIEMNKDVGTLDIKLKPGVALFGKVVDPEDKGIIGAWIMPTLWLPMVGISMGRPQRSTDIEGNFEIKAMPAGYKYVVSVSADGYGSKSSMEIQTDGLAVDRRFDVGIIKLLVTNLSVSGIIVDANDKPVADAAVISEGEGQPHHSKRTGANGKFFLEKVCNGRIRISAATYGTTPLHGSVDTYGGATDVKIVVTEQGTHSFVPKQFPSLIGSNLPEFQDLEIAVRPDDLKNRKILLCFWDMNQRPSRNLVVDLATREKELTEKNVAVYIVHTSKVEPAKVKEWLDNRNILFPCGSINNDAEKVLFIWGVRAQPWLILTDENRIVRAEGFSIEQLNEKILAKSSDLSLEDEEVIQNHEGQTNVEYRGLVQDEKGDPIAGAKVCWFSKQSGGLSLNLSEQWNHPDVLTTDKRGEFMLRNVFGNKIGIYVKAEGYAQCMIGPLVLPEDSKKLKQIVLQPGADVFGRVILEDGQNVVGARISANIFSAQLHKMLSSPWPCLTTKTDENGFYRLVDLPAGQLSIGVNSPTAKGNLNMAQKKIDLEHGDKVELNFGDEEGFTLTGIVTVDGEAVEIAEVLIQLPDESTKWGWTDRNGNFRITGIPGGQYQLFTTYDKDLDPVTFIWGKDGKQDYDTRFDRRQITIENDRSVDIRIGEQRSSDNLLAKSPAPSGVDKSIVRVDLSVVEVPPDSKMDRETTVLIKNLLAGKITVPDSPAVADLLRKAAEATAAVEDSSAGDKRVTQEQFDTLLDLLLSRGFVKILMNPTLEVVEGQTAQIKTDQNSLEVTINAVKDDIIYVHVKADLSSQSVPKVEGQKPIISRRSFASMVLVSPGQSVIIGGVVDMPARPDDKGNAKGSQTPAGELMCIVTAIIVAPPADKPMIRVYDISDLVGATISRGTVDGMMDGSGDMMGGFGGMGRSVNIPDQAIVNEAQNIVNLIMQTIDLNSWYENDPNAKGIITPFPAARPRKLAIYQTPPAHQQIEKLLESRREQIDTTQISIELRYLYTNAEFLDEVRDSMNIEFTSNTFLDDKQVETLLRASQKKRDIRSLTAPGVTVLNNETARFNTARHIFMSFLDYSEPNNLSKQSPSVSINTFCRITPHIEDNKNIIVDFVQDIPGLHERIIYDRRKMVQSYTETTAITNKRIPNNKTFAFTCDIIKFDQDNQTASPAEKKTLIVLIKPTIIAQEEMPRSNAAAMILNPLRSKGYTAEQTDETIYLKPMPEERPGTDKSQIMIDTKILTASDEFLKYIGLDPNSVARSEGWSDYLVHSTDDSASFVIDKHRADLIIKASATHKDVQVLHSSRMLAKSGMKFETHITDSEHYILVGGPPDSNVFSREPESESNPIELGTTIRLTPTLTPDGKNIELDFEWEYRRLRRLKEHTGPDGKVQKIPIVDVDTIKTPCTIPDGKTLLITGKKITVQKKKEPGKSGLAGLPLIGWLFNSPPQVEETINLLILIKPSIDPPTSINSPINAPPKPKPIDPNDPLIKKLEEKFKRQTKPTN